MNKLGSQGGLDSASFRSNLINPGNRIEPSLCFPFCINKKFIVSRAGIGREIGAWQGIRRERNPFVLGEDLLNFSVKWCLRAFKPDLVFGKEPGNFSKELVEKVEGIFGVIQAHRASVPDWCHLSRLVSQIRVGCHHRSSAGG